jgi:plastocyanin
VRRVATLVVAGVALVLALPAVAAAPPARVQVSAQEYAFTLSRSSIKAGKVIVQLVNFGEDPHDLRLKRIGGTRTYAIRVVQSGDSADLETTLKAGTFQLWCSIADHRARGMSARLRVVAAS